MTLTAFEKAHAASILEEPTLEPTPDIKCDRILIASVVRKPPPVVAALCKTLQWQQLRKAKFDFALIPNYAASDSFASESLAAIRAAGIEPWPAVEAPGNDYGDAPRTRAWTNQAWHRVGALKDKVLRYALAERYDAVWLVDADVLCDPHTLQSLLDCGAPIVSAVYWTQWQRPLPDDAVKQHAGPQVWLRHPYCLDGRGWAEPEFRAALAARRRTQVWGLGACTLIRRDALEKGVAFARVGDLPSGPMSDGEDRHFCWRANALHIQMYADPWSDVWHAYHPDDYDEIPERLAALQVPHPEQPRIGDLVSLKITPLEPVATNRGWLMPSPQWIRGRLGALPLLPELEEAAASLHRGDSKLVEVHFPVFYEEAGLRGERRLMQLDLLDCKPFRLPPTLDEELIVGSTGRVVDPVAHPAANVESLLEAVNA